MEPPSPPHPESTPDRTPLGPHPLAEHGSQVLRRMQASLRRRMFDGPAPTLGRFTVLGRLGNGGMGVVYEAHDPDLDRRIAIKVLRPGSTATGARLVREARRLARLNHPNVVTIHEVGDLEGEVFLVMELLGGGTLRAWLGAERRPWRDALGLLLDAGRGLAAAHQLGLVHGDFKPDNVLLGDDGRPRVVDFGLTRDKESVARAAAISDDRRAATARQCSGTPAYMAPEQSRGLCSARSDQYAFCVVLHEALLGRHPACAPPQGADRTRPVVRDRPPNSVGTTAPEPCTDARALVEATRPRSAARDGRDLDATLRDGLEQTLDAAAAVIDGVCDGAGRPDPRANQVLGCVRSRVLHAQTLASLRYDGTVGTAMARDVVRRLPSHWAPYGIATYRPGTGGRSPIRTWLTGKLPTQKSDFDVISIADGGCTGTGGNPMIAVTVMNRGAVTRSAWVDVFTGLAAAPVVGDYATLLRMSGSVAPEGTKTVYFEVTSGFTSGWVDAVLDTTQTVDELDETNNVGSAYLTLPGCSFN